MRLCALRGLLQFFFLYFQFLCFDLVVTSNSNGYNDFRSNLVKLVERLTAMILLLLLVAVVLWIAMMIWRFIAANYVWSRAGPRAYMLWQSGINLLTWLVQSLLKSVLAVVNRMYSGVQRRTMIVRTPTVILPPSSWNLGGDHGLRQGTPLLA